MTCILKTTLSAAVLVALVSSPALAADYPTDFNAIDTDNNGQVTFAEYSSAVKANGVSTTQAAQQFTRMSAGDATITEDEFNIGLAFQDQLYALQAVTGGQTISFVASEAPLLEPQIHEVQDSPVADSEPIIAPAPVETAPSENIEITLEPETKVITEPVPEIIAPTTTSTSPEIILETQEPELPTIELPKDEMLETDLTEPETTDILEEEPAPQPEG